MNLCQNPSKTSWKEMLGPERSREEVLGGLERDEVSRREYEKLSERLKEEFLQFGMGTRGVKLTYNPMFKMVFSPELHPERLEEFLGLCLGEKLKIVQILPNESRRLTEEGSLLVMDILVRLETGALVNVEIQRMGYLFPGARCACYSSDLVMRQYSQVREQRKSQGQRFSYHDIKKVYTIVLIQKSTKEFHALPTEHLHYARQVFNTGLELDLLQEYLLIPLDIFMKNHHNISNRLDAWLYCIASDSLEDIKKVVEAYPEFIELYREVFAFRNHTRELVSMFSEALKILDANTTQYMIEIQQEEIKKLEEENQKQKEENQRQQEEIARLKELLAEQKGK